MGLADAEGADPGVEVAEREVVDGVEVVEGAKGTERVCECEAEIAESEVVG